MELFPPTPATLAEVPPDIDGLDSEAWIARGDGLSIEDRLLEESLLCYSNAISLAPLDVEAWTSKGAALMRLGRYESAAESYAGVIECEPDDVDRP